MVIVVTIGGEELLVESFKNFAYFLLLMDRVSCLVLNCCYAIFRPSAFRYRVKEGDVLVSTYKPQDPTPFSREKLFLLVCSTKCL